MIVKIIDVVPNIVLMTLVYLLNHITEVYCLIKHWQFWVDTPHELHHCADCSDVEGIAREPAHLRIAQKRAIAIFNRQMRNDAAEGEECTQL